MLKLFEENKKEPPPQQKKTKQNKQMPAFVVAGTPGLNS